MSRARSLAAAVFGIVLATSVDASAERVVLVRPAKNDPVLFDAWNRLAAELRIHHFEVETAETRVGQAPESMLAGIAEKAQALAAIALVRHGKDASVDVWLVDRASGKTTLRTILVESGGDASSVLAIRAVDLLRASLREFGEGNRPPKDVVGVDPRPATPALATFTAQPELRVRLRADALLLVERGAGVAVGPTLSLSYRLTDRFELGLAGAGPLVGGRIDTARGSASLVQGMAWCDLRFAVVRERGFEAGVNTALGAYFLGATGEPLPPLRSRNGHLVSALGGFGIHAELALVPTVAVGLAVRAVAMLPRPGVAVGEESSPIELPVLVTSAGIRISL
jgi:hypothetical protein